MVSANIYPFDRVSIITWFDVVLHEYSWEFQKIQVPPCPISLAVSYTD
jgi:hypothetical protein